MDKVSDIKTLKTSRNYATALFDAAREQNVLEKVTEDLNIVTQTVSQSSELQNFLYNPSITPEIKKSALSDIFDGKISESAKNFLMLLADNSRFNLLEQILSEFNILKDKNKNVTIVKAVTAVEMKDYLKQALKTKLETILSKTVELNYEIAPEIIGGLIIETDGKVIDNSVFTHLKKIKTQLT